MKNQSFKHLQVLMLLGLLWLLPLSQITLAQTSPSANGQYQTLLKKISCPEDLADNGSYRDYGLYHEADGDYCGSAVPTRGYWVYVAPHWYIWQDKVLQPNQTRLLKQVKLKTQTLTLEMTYFKPHKAWAEQILNYAAKSIQDLESLSGRAYPGQNPYPIEEKADMGGLLGLASGAGMHLASPPKGTPWTLVHEVVHIWNAGTEPAWVREGQANYLSWLIMQKNKFPFVGDETLPAFLRDWQEIRGTEDDLLLEKYDELPQGKAMEYWLLHHELFGPDFIWQAFGFALDHEDLQVTDWKNFLKRWTPQDTQKLLSGWVNTGPYLVKKAEDFGPLKYPVSGAR